MPFLILLPQRILKSIMAIPRGRLQSMQDLQRLENFRASIPINHSLRKFTRSQSPCPSLENLRLLQKRHPRFLHRQRRFRQTNRRSPIMQIFRTVRRWNISLSCPKRPVCSFLWQKMLVFLQIIPVSWRIRERNFFLTLIRKH